MSDKEQERWDGKGCWGICGSYHHSPQKNSHTMKERGRRSGRRTEGGRESENDKGRQIEREKKR